jgi:hypothetical protein
MIKPIARTRNQRTELLDGAKTPHGCSSTDVLDDSRLWFALDARNA